MDAILLKTKKELDIYMNPRRQQLLRAMRLSGIPMTPKQISDQLGISASAVSYHIKLLTELGVLAIDHVEVINGINATFYIRTGTPVSFLNGMEEDQEGLENRLLMAQSLLAQITEGYFSVIRQISDPTEMQKTGDLSTGIVHLKPGEAQKMFAYFHQFIQEHYEPAPGTHPWELALIAYDTNHQTRGVDHDDQK